MDHNFYGKHYSNECYRKQCRELSKKIDTLTAQRDALLTAAKAASTWITLKTDSHCACGQPNVTRKNIRKELDDAIGLCKLETNHDLTRT